jgi:hypothetical protein
MMRTVPDSEQGALRPLEHLDALHVIDVDVGRAINGRNRLFVEVHTDAWLRAGVVAVAAADDAADIDMRAARLTVTPLALTADVGDARRVLDVVVEVYDAELLEFRRVEHGDADRDVLQVLDALLSGHHDLCQAASRLGGCLRLGGVLRVSRGYSRE